MLYNNKYFNAKTSKNKKKAIAHIDPALFTHSLGVMCESSFRRSFLRYKEKKLKNRNDKLCQWNLRVLQQNLYLKTKEKAFLIENGNEQYFWMGPSWRRPECTFFSKKKKRIKQCTVTSDSKSHDWEIVLQNGQ